MGKNMVARSAVCLAAVFVGLVSAGNPHAPSSRISIAPPILTDIYPLAGDIRGGNVVTLGGHSFNDTSEVSVTPLQKMSNGPNWGLQCLFMMSPPVKVPAAYVSETSVICTAPEWTGQEGEPASKPLDLTQVKMPVDRKIKVQVSHDGVKWSNKLDYAYGEGDCCHPHVGGGCMNPEIMDCVCMKDKECCDKNKHWDGLCVQNVRTLSCEYKGAYCPGKSIAKMNTKWASLHLPLRDRNSMQIWLDKATKDLKVEAKAQAMNNTKAMEAPQEPSDSELFVPFADKKRTPPPAKKTAAPKKK